MSASSFDNWVRLTPFGGLVGVAVPVSGFRSLFRSCCESWDDVNRDDRVRGIVQRRKDGGTAHLHRMVT